MKIEKLSLVSFKGGLNDRDLASGLAVDEAQVLENYFTDGKSLLEKRPGKEIIQYAPIDPSVYVNDANTLAHYAFDETNDPLASVIDSSGNFRDMGFFDSHSLSPTAPALFPIGAGLGRSSLIQDNLIVSNGTKMQAQFSAGSSFIDGLTAMTMRGWAIIPSSFTGAPVNISRLGNAIPPFSNSGATLFGTNLFDASISNQSAGISNGFSLYRDYAAPTTDWPGGNTSDPYVKFTLRTRGIAGTVTVLQSRPLAMGVMLEFKFTYDSTTGVAELYVNGDLHATANVVGAGVVDDPNSNGLAAFGSDIQAGGIFGFVFKTCAGVVLDEWELSDVVRTDFKYKNPRGLGFEYANSDGTRQAVVSADEGLYYTLGDGSWNKMLMYGGVLDAEGFTTPAFDTAAYWDAIFRKDILYLSNGVDSPLAWDGETLVNWGIPVNAPTLSLSATAAVITAGTRRVVYTYLYGTYETGFSPYTEIQNPSAFQINVNNIPPRHANCTGVRIYMTKAGSTDTYYLVREIPHTPGALMSISGTYAAGSPAGYSADSGALGPADGDLGGTDYPLVESQVATALMPNPQFLLAEHDRVFCCGMNDEPYTLRWSELGALDVFTVFSFAQAAANRGNLIALASYYGEVHCSKDGRATLILRGSNPQNWRVLETLHPTIGAIDHWSYVHRYPFNSDQYVLCFAARDGFYKYAGQQIECISDKLAKTVDRLAAGNATRNEWNVTTTKQWQDQTTGVNPGAATANIQQPRYETDGLREDGGTAKIVDQLDYLGLWNDDSPLVSGNVIAVCKGVNEGEFYFATDAAGATAGGDLYWTPDNFITVQTVPGNTLQTDERIIEIVRRGTDDFYFLITDSAGTAGSSGGGNIYTVDDPMGTGGTGPIWATLTSAALYYDLDVTIRGEGAGISGGNSGRAIGPLNNSVSPYNIYINHQQNVQLQRWQNITQDSDRGRTTTNFFTGGTSVTSPCPNKVFELIQTGISQIDQAIAAPIGFCSAAVFKTDGSAPPAQFDIQLLSVQYTRREFPRWRGGTFGPQAYWDATNSRLLFLASTAENGSGNRSTYLRTLTEAGVLVNQYTTQNVSAFVADGTSVWFATTLIKSLVIGTVTYGFTSYLRKSSLATPGTVTATFTDTDYLVITRLNYNSQNTAALMAASKYLAAVTPQEFWTYKAYLRQYLTATAAFVANRDDLTASGDSGAVYMEFAVQTVTPYRTYVAVSRLSTAEPVPLYVVQPATLAVSAFESDSYTSPTGALPVTGILSNLLFVPASGNANGSLWADRLYWWASAASSSDARFLQHGVPGDWTVIGVFSSESHQLGDFSAFENLESDYDNHNNANGVGYEMRNAASAAALAAAVYKAQAPNAKILGFSPVASYVQWRLTLTWTYDSSTGAVVTSSPTVEFINIGFFLGQANLARTTGFHWQGRTFWACAEDGSLLNNVVLVYQKNNTWMKIYGWNLKSIFRFRNQMVGLEAYQFERLMTAFTDAGALIVGRARTGTIMGYVDKMLVRLQANVASLTNNLFSSRDGYAKITPYQNNTPLSLGAWVIPIPNAELKEAHRVLGVPSDEFYYAWARAYSLEISTSEDTEGDWVPYVGQPEEIQALDLELELTGDAYDIVVQ